MPQAYTNSKYTARGEFSQRLDLARHGGKLVLHLSRVVRMETEFHGGDALCIGCGAEDLALVVLQRLDLAGDVAGVSWNVGRDAEFVRHECGCQLGAQLFHRISRRT